MFMASFRKIFSLALVVCVVNMSPALFAQAQCGTQPLKIPLLPRARISPSDLDDKGAIVGTLTSVTPAGELKLTTPRIIIGFGLDVACGISNH
jgi:hypothetical protein